VNYRLTFTTAAAVILASVSLYPLISGIAWFWAGCGAVVIAALAGLATRLQPLPAACVAAGLALIATFPLLASPHPYLGVTGLVIVAAAAASVTRWGLLPAAATLITYLASQLIYINLVFAPGASNAGVIPTTASLWRLGTLVSQGVGERIYAPPVPDHSGAVMLAAAGIGLMAVAADLIAVRLRSPAIAGLPLLVLFSVPITTSAKQGPVGATIAFCLAITGYLAVLAADGRDRLRIWGRLVTLWQTGKDGEEQVRGPDTRALAASGRRIGLAAVCVAIFIPLLIPGIKIHKLFNGHGTATGGHGSNGVTLPSPLVELRGQLLPGKHIPVLTYSTNSPDPFDQYLQVYVLNFDPKSGEWVLAPSSRGVPVTRALLPPPPGLAGSAVRSFTTRIKLASGLAGYTGGVSYLPVPYAPAKVTVDGSWSADASTLMISSLDQHLAGLSYSATSQEVLPTSQELDAAGPPPSDVLRQYGLFPATSDSPLRKLAQRITKHASTLYGKAMAIQDWFTKPDRFIYTTNASQPNTLAGLLRFLTTARQGYCQQFAFGMAALARLIGIPARVAVGYTAGTRQTNGNWLVTSADAHAWPELYFQGAGWLRFEPTPGGSAGQGTAFPPVYARSGISTVPGGGPGQTSPGGSTGNLPGGPSRGLPGNGRLRAPGGGTGTAAPLAHRTSVPVLPIVAVVLVILALLPRTARSVSRWRRWRSAHDPVAAAHVAWRELRDDLTDHGWSWHPSDSPRAVSRRVGRMLGLSPAGREALDRITAAEEHALYAKTARTPSSLRSDVTTIRRAMASEATTMTRWQARLLPPSCVRPALSSMTQALDVFGWLDAAGQRMRGLGGGLRGHAR
jgi:transglutaminase-like putative cysteine protease